MKSVCLVIAVLALAACEQSQHSASKSNEPVKRIRSHRNIAVSTAQGLRMRAEPDRAVRIIASLQKDEEVFIIAMKSFSAPQGAHESPWCQVVNSAGQIGWVLGKYLEYAEGDTRSIYSDSETFPEVTLSDFSEKFDAGKLVHTKISQPPKSRRREPSAVLELIFVSHSKTPPYILDAWEIRDNEYDEVTITIDRIDDFLGDNRKEIYVVYSASAGDGSTREGRFYGITSTGKYGRLGTLILGEGGTGDVCADEYGHIEWSPVQDEQGVKKIKVISEYRSEYILEYKADGTPRCGEKTTASEDIYVLEKGKLVRKESKDIPVPQSFQ